MVNLTHMAIIMDGNRRWAYQRNKSARLGHEQGSKIIKDIARHAYDRGARWLTLFAFSSENWQRPSLERKGIMDVLKHYLTEEFHQLSENNIRFRVIGDLSRFSDDIVSLLKKSVSATAGNDGLNLTIALGYGGRSDIVHAMKSIAKKVASGDLAPDAITENMVKDNLYSAALPPIDLLLRTGCEKRVSNFLLWDLAYAELIFSDLLWPDFTPAALDDVFAEYDRRQRRFGGSHLTTKAARSTG